MMEGKTITNSNTWNKITELMKFVVRSVERARVTLALNVHLLDGADVRPECVFICLIHFQLSLRLIFVLRRSDFYESFDWYMPVAWTHQMNSHLHWIYILHRSTLHLPIKCLKMVIFLVTESREIYTNYWVPSESEFQSVEYIKCMCHFHEWSQTSTFNDRMMWSV